MAYDLVARLKLVDNMSQPLKKAVGGLDGMKKQTDAVTKAINSANKEQKMFHDVNGRLRDDMGRFVSEGNRYGGMFDRMGGSMSGLRGHVTGLHTSLLALGAAYGVVSGGKKLFDATLGSAANQEYSKLTIEGLLNNTKKSTELFQKMKQQGLDSSMFSFQDFLDGSKAFIPMTKNIGQLERLTQLTERLALSNPDTNKGGGFESAVFAIRELMSGDSTSIVERFNLPRQWVNEIKGKTGDDFINGVDKLLNKIGFSDQFKKKIADESALAKYAQISEKISQGFTDMGMAGLEKAKPILDRIDAMLSSGKFSGIQSLGSDMIASVVGATEQAVVSFDQFVAHIESDASWKKLSIGDKLVRITQEGMDAVNKWLADGGSKKIEEWAKAVAEPSLQIGIAIGKGIVDGLSKYLEDSPVASAIMGGLVGGRVAGAPGVVAGAGYSVVDSATKEFTDTHKYIPFSGGNYKPNTAADEPNTWDLLKGWYDRTFSNPSSNYNGLASVPFDNFPALLHRGERVSNPAQGQSAGGVNVTVHMNGVTIREDMDIQRMMYTLAQEIKGAAVNTA